MGSRLAALIESQRPQLALWVPVLFGLGIALYFASPAEPPGFDARGARRRRDRRSPRRWFAPGRWRGC